MAKTNHVLTNYLLNEEIQCGERVNDMRLLTGDDLVEIFSLEPSPLFRTLLDRVQEFEDLDVIRTREEALGWVKTWLGRGE